MCHCSPVAVIDLTPIMTKLAALEALMATEVEALAALEAKVDDLIADVRAGLEQVRAEVSPAGQAALDALTAKLDAFDAEVGDRDGSDTPPPPPVEE